MSIKLMEHQIEAANKAYNIFLKYGLVYIFGKPRIGKSLVSLQLIKKCQNIEEGKVIVFTKKNAINDWLKYKEFIDFDITNYERVTKTDASQYDYVIIDEAHNFGAFPRPSQRCRDMRGFCLNKKIIFLSGTPFVEGALKAYNQFNLSSFSPFLRFKNGFEFFKEYGVSHKIYVAGRDVETYSKCKTDEILGLIDPYMIKIDYKDARFEYKNQDEIVWIEDEKIYDIQQNAIKNRIATDEVIRNRKNINYKEKTFERFSSYGKTIHLENISALCQFLHRLCGGFYEDLDLDFSQKVEWMENFGSEHGKKGEKIAIMCYYKQEQEYFQNFFKDYPNIQVLSSTKYCEGVDLSHCDKYVLYSFGYSGSKFIQLRDRIVNLNKNKVTKVIIPLTCSPDGDIFDAKVYERVKEKENFNTRTLGGLIHEAYYDKFKY